MGKGLNIFVLALVAVLAASFGTCKAQTTHIVGSDLGWNVPSAVGAYSNWASGRSFAVGDVLVFNFVTRAHDVAVVTKASFDGCNGDSPISMSNTGPTNITLRTAGENFFICTIGGHCNAGQKLAINVTGTTVAAPPSPPSSTPPPPSISSTTYTVGDGLGWNILADGGAYRNWAANKTFMVGDTLVFNFVNGTHDVAEVTKSAFDSCNTSNATCLVTTSPANITLTTVGEHFFTCSFPNHCSAGQKLSINVTEATATPPCPSPDSTTPATPSPTGTAAPPPPESSAPSFAAAALPFSVALLSIAVGLFY